jgi:hypothetical protein
MHKLFALQEAQEQQKQQAQGMIVTPAGSEQVSLPEGALSNPNEALNPSSRRTKRGRPAKGGSSITQPEQEQQQPDPQLQQLLAQFQPFAQALQAIARQQQQQRQQQLSRRSKQELSAQTATTAAEAQPRSSSSSAGLPVQEQAGLQQQREQHIKAPGRTTRLLELFGTPEPVPAPIADPLIVQPSQAKQAAQRLAQMIMQQQQQARKQRQRQQPGDAQEDAAAEGTAGPAAAAAAQAHAADSAVDAPPAHGAAGDVLASAVPQAGATRIYMPAPPLSEASSAAERQPLRLLSIRQQEQLRKDARAEAIRKVRRAWQHGS